MQILLPVHILAGTITLISAALAMSSAKGKKLHIYAGRGFFGGMVAIFLTAIPMSIITGNIFLFLIALFSFYLAFAGMRFAQNRKGVAETIDWVAIGFMLFSGICMWMLAAFYFISGNSQYIVLIVFGFIALALGFGDVRSYKNKTATGKERIAKHLSRMMGGMIAVITAVLVVNVDIEPQWVFWVLPIAIITPAIFWQTYKTRN